MLPLAIEPKELVALEKWAAILADSVNVLGVVVALGYFAWKILFQKTLQRLTGTLKATPIDGTGNVLVELTIENNAEVRIDFTEVKCAIVPAGTQIRPIGAAGTPFPRNLLKGRGEVHSVDAKSMSHFIAIVPAPTPPTHAIVMAEWTPKLTGDTYRSVTML